MSEIDEKMLTNMSPEDQKYYKKYLKYKNKYIELEKNMNGAGLGLASALKLAKSTAKSAAKSPLAKEIATTAIQSPTVQTKLQQVQTAYANSPNTQLVAQVAMSNPSVQTEMEKPIVQSTLQGSNSPDNVWRTLTLEQKTKLIKLLPTI